MRRFKDTKTRKLVKEVYEDFKKTYGRYPLSPEIRQILKDTFNWDAEERFIRICVSEINPEAKRSGKQIAFCEVDKLVKDFRNIIDKEYQMIDTDVRVRCKYPSKWLIVDDEHFPFCNIEAFKTIVETDGDADGIAISEIVDRQEFSIFPKRSYIDPVKVDQKTGEFVNYLESKFKYGVILMGNNHWLRLLKWIQKLPNPEQTEILTYLTNGGLPKFTEKIEHFQLIRSFICQIGKAVYCHPEDYLGNPLKTVLRIVDWLRNQGDLFGINDFDSVWTGHTHRLCLDYSSSKHLIAEVGCVCHQQPYTLTGKLAHGSKGRWTMGYGVLCLDKNGNTDYHKSGIKYLDYTTIPLMEK